MRQGVRKSFVNGGSDSVGWVARVLGAFGVVYNVVTDFVPGNNVFVQQGFPCANEKIPKKKWLGNTHYMPLTNTMCFLNTITRDACLHGACMPSDVLTN